MFLSWQLTCLVAVAGRGAAQLCMKPIECKNLDNLEQLLSGGGGSAFPPCDLEDGSQGVMCTTPAAEGGGIANR